MSYTYKEDVVKEFLSLDNNKGIAIPSTLAKAVSACSGPVGLAVAITIAVAEIWCIHNKQNGIERCRTRLWSWEIYSLCLVRCKGSDYCLSLNSFTNTLLYRIQYNKTGFKLYSQLESVKIKNYGI